MSAPPSKQPSAEELREQGRSLVRQGRLAEGEACLRQAVGLRPTWADAQHDLAQALHRQGRLREAVTAYEDALRLQAQSPEVCNNLGAALLGLGLGEVAAARFRQAVRLRPDYPEAHNNLAVVLGQLGRPEEAAAVCREALAHWPDYADLWNSLGIALARQGNREEAAEAFGRAVRLKPASADMHRNLGQVLHQARRFAEAEASFRESLRLRPAQPEVHTGLGQCLAELGRLSEAAACYREVLRLRPDSPEAHNSLAVALLKSGDLEGGRAACDEAIRLRPQFAEAHANRASAWLLQGDFEQGWPEYEWRWHSPHAVPRTFDRPRWQGEALRGHTILLWAEQGLGDVLQFVRYAPQVRERGGRVLVEVPAGLIPMLGHCPGIDRLVPSGEPPSPSDVHAPLLSLPGILHTTLSTVPADVPYLAAEPARIDRWRSAVEAVPGFRVGIAWQGSPRHPADHQRSIPLRHFAALARVPGMSLVSLQKGAGQEQLAEVARDWPVHDLGPGLDPQDAILLDTAAVMTQLDLVITCDSALAHLAGALGVPVWVALFFAHDWRWLAGRDDSPWYPTMRLFRQRRWGDWDEVFTRMAGELARRHSAALRRPLVAELAPGELLDKISILEIKRQRLSEAAKRANVCVELGALAAARARSLREPPELDQLVRELRQVNEQLWEVEDSIRDCERHCDFGPRFVELARSVYRLNDHRAALKRRINDRCGSALVEEKSYAKY
jgi:Flp pilus assembly protein TadD